MQQTINNIEKVIKKELGEYYNCAWREKITELIEAEERYKYLVDWINNELDISIKIANVFCPADIDKKYTKGDVKLYLEQMQKIAVLTHCKILLLEFNSTNKMRKNIEYTIEKLYNVKYNNELKCYL